MASEQIDRLVNSHNANELLAIAREAASRASKLVRTSQPGKITMKGDRDPTSEVDLAVEQLVHEYLSSVTPDIGFLSEEQGSNKLGHELLWILDPIDGTVNFIHGVPLCAVSLSLAYNGRAHLAVIDLPFIGTQYTALR
jgi:myo-inositol-1(or 4)-monophosphatase